MHPAKSVIFFTVSSGAGYGLLAILAALDAAAVPTGLGTRGILGALALGLGLVTAGFLSSTLHLANPRNAWRALFRVRTSWLSREGLLALLCYPVTLAWGVLLVGGEVEPGAWRRLSAVLSLLVALATLFSTGMIYACLRTIPQWHTALTPLNYLLFGLMSGALLAVALTGAAAPVAPLLHKLTLALIAAAGVAKLAWYWRAGLPRGPSIQDATGLHRARVRLLDVGHSAGTFLTREFGFCLSPGVSLVLRALALALAVVAPAALLVGGGAVLGGWLAPACVLAGLLLERYLFFSDARHVVNLYHGAQNTRC